MRGASQIDARYAWRMQCSRCAAEISTSVPATRPQGSGTRGRTDEPGAREVWCRDCELQYDTWVRQHATDILWQTGLGAIVAMVIGLGLPLLGLEPIIGIAGVLAGFGTFMGLRRWGKQRRRRQFLTGALPRAYLPSKT
jgi:hypothetical protein